MTRHTTSTPKTKVTTPALDPGLMIRGRAWHGRRARIRREKQWGFGLGSLATFLIALAIPTVAPPASATTSLILAAEPQCSSSKVLGGNYDARACVEGLGTSRYQVTASFTNGTDQQVDLTMKLSLAAGSSTYDVHTCSLQVGPRGNANCQGWRSFSPAPSGSVSGRVVFTSSGRSTLVTTAAPSSAPAPAPSIPGPTIPSSPGAGTSDTASASQALTLVNLERAKAGCASLRVVQKLQAPAGQQSRDQAARDRIGHDGADGSGIDGRLGGLGYSRWAENVAQHQTAQQAVNAWLTSTAGHREHMLNCAFTETGLAVARSASGKLYWTQTFGG